MPSAPKFDGRGGITHASHHIFRWIDAVDKSPQSEESPWDEQFEPDDVKIEVAQHGELHRREQFPVRLRIEDGDGVQIVLDYHFHAE